MYDNTNLDEIAYENSLVLATTTIGRNGYPENLKPAIIGFDSFEDAQELAKEHGLIITTLFKKDGWDLWVRNNETTYEPLKASSNDFGDNYREYSSIHYDNIEDFYNQECSYIKDEIANLSFQELKDNINRLENLYFEIKFLSEDEVLISDGFNHYVYPKELMNYSYDTKNFIIGLIQDEK
jgi:hypothetical protein